MLMKKTKIISSIGPASNNYETFKKIVHAGMNVARVNFSHATMEERKIVEDLVKKINEEENANIGLLFDTKGPEFRSGEVENGEIELVAGETIRIVKNTVIGNKERFSVNHPQAIADLKIGDSVLLVNGLIKTEVVSVEDDGVTVKILNGGVLGNHKSMAAPGVKLEIPFISDIDREDITYACHHNGDYLALSFVSSRDDVLEARELLKENNRGDMQIISKIESVTGIENLDEIIEVSDGIMVARGDLGVEVPMEMLPIYQRMIVNKCREAGKICVIATEMLVSMKKSIRPTRAEVSDVANAVFNGTDAVMLSDETTIGSYPIDTVKTMANICENAEKYYDYNKKFNISWKSNITATIAKSVITASKDLESKVIVAATMSGRTARKISNLKPICPILATVPNEKVARSLALNYGVYSAIVNEYKNTDEIVTDAVEQSKEFTNLNKGDTIIITGGFPNTGEKTTNFMKIEEI
jgi:pyruvate kinase